MIAKPIQVRRAAFTLVELLVTISIISILLGMSVGIYFRIRVTQQDSATNTVMQKIGSAYDRNMRAVQDNAKQDARPDTDKIPAWVKTLSANGAGVMDNRRALIIWTKIQMKREFPQNFWEVMVWQTTMQQYVGQTTKSSYYRAIEGINPQVLVDPNKAGLTAAEIDQLHQESAALLYLSVTQNQRRGESGLSDELLSNGVMTVTLYGKDFKVFRDTWMHPIAFIRWPFNRGADLNQPPFRQDVAITGSPWTWADPQDPEQTLHDKNWPQANRDMFVKIIGHPIDMQNGPLNLSPVIFSAGRDGLWGIDQTYSIVSQGEDDNLYGYRLRGMGRK